MCVCVRARAHQCVEKERLERETQIEAQRLKVDAEKTAKLQELERKKEEVSLPTNHINFTSIADTSLVHRDGHRRRSVPLSHANDFLHVFQQGGFVAFDPSVVALRDDLVFLFFKSEQIDPRMKQKNTFRHFSRPLLVLSFRVLTSISGEDRSPRTLIPVSSETLTYTSKRESDFDEASSGSTRGSAESARARNWLSTFPA